MSIFVAGPSGGKPYDKDVALKIESAIAIMSAKLGIAHVPMEFDITMGRTVNKTDGDCQGWCWAKQYKKSKPWEVSIFIWRKKRFRDMIKTLAHEMIHVKQFVKDGLDLSSEPTFKGKKFVAKKSQDEYWDAPWEKEAYSKQDALAEYYFNYLKKNA
jgi:hypothetical protein|tara:strand:- start:42 stop:512 length:471 start_codon:yes stop_codon:yes gene_type:complete